MLFPFLHHLVLVLSWLAIVNPAPAKQPNIVFILTDDQDLRLSSPLYMPALQRHIISKGLEASNHYGTVSLCCPARTTLLRGQTAHNTNLTHVGGPGGGYAKFLRSGEMASYLPLWLQSAGYRTGYIGKFMNGFNSHSPLPPGWDESEILTAPWIYRFNHVVTRRNGGEAKWYEGWHQTDVMRLRALEVLERFTAPELGGGEKPFYLTIAPATPHVVVPGAGPTVPLARHKFHFPGILAPRTPNWNPGDEVHVGKPAWVGELPRMHEALILESDKSYRARLQGLQGVDEIVEGVVALLERKGVLDETFIIYSTDNGFHLGQHRVPGGKGLPYLEDVNLPFAVRGPGVKAGRRTAVPSTHVDFAPTMLDIAGLPRDEWPEFFDGRSLLPEWLAANDEEVLMDSEVSREVVNVEYWGSATLPAGKYTEHRPHNSYKSLRIVSHDGGKGTGWLFNRWCTKNQTELYDTVADPYELKNLALDADEETKKLMDRLSGLLLVTKSCGQETCRRPWDVLWDAYRETQNQEPQLQGTRNRFGTLEQAMDARYDAFFAALPSFGFQFCLPYQLVENEGPFLPAESEDLGRKYREMTDNEPIYGIRTNFGVDAAEEQFFGDISQRYASVDELNAAARTLTKEEMGSEVELGEEDWLAEMDDD